MNSKIIGVDFSGAQNAGEKIWVARSFQNGPTLRFDFLTRACDLPNGHSSRDVAFGALVAWLQNELEPCARVGFDFPFALTARNLADKSWHQWINSLQKFESAEAFRAAFHDEKRVCDVQAKAPFSPLNLRLYRQTFHGIRDVLSPLLSHGARALPFEEDAYGAPVLMEVCPASLLKRDRLYLSYKGQHPQQRENRALIFEALRRKYGFQTPVDIETLCLENSEGDALDAVIAALCVARTPDLEARNDREKKEGRIYF